MLTRQANARSLKVGNSLVFVGREGTEDEDRVYPVILEEKLKRGMWRVVSEFDNTQEYEVDAGDLFTCNNKDMECVLAIEMDDFRAHYKLEMAKKNEIEASRLVYAATDEVNACKEAMADLARRIRAHKKN